jgi:hypothetical protein
VFGALDIPVIAIGRELTERQTVSILIQGCRPIYFLSENRSNSNGKRFARS